MALRDLIARVILRLDKTSAMQTQAELNKTLKDGTDPTVPKENLNQIGASMDDLARKVRSAAQAFGLFVAGRALIRFGEDAVRSFVAFDAKMTQSLAIMENVGGGMRAEMEDVAHALAINLNIPSAKVAEGFYFLASAGLTAEQAVQALPIAAAFAKAGMFDLAKATEMLSVSQSALGLTSNDAAKNMENMRRVSDVLSKANSLTNGSVEQLASSLSHRAAATMRQFNIEVEEGVAVLAAYAKQGTVAELGGEEFMRFITRLTSAYGKHKAAFDELKITIYDPKDKGKLLPLADIVDQLTRALGPLSLAQRTAALEAMGFVQEAQGAIRPLLGMGDVIRQYQKELENAGGATQRLANNQMKALGERIGQLHEQWDQLKQDIGKDIVEGVQKSDDQFGSLAATIDIVKESVASAGPAIRDFAGGAAFLTEVLVGTTVVLATGFLNGLNVVANFIVGTLKEALAIGAGSVSLLVGAFGALTEVLGGILSLGGLAKNPVSDFFDKIGASAIEAAKKVLGFSNRMGEEGIDNFLLKGMRTEEDPEQSARVDKQRADVRKALREHGVKPKTAGKTAEDIAEEERQQREVDLRNEAQRRKDAAAAQRRADFLRDLTMKVASEAGDAFSKAVAEIDKLEKKAHEVFGKTLPDEVQNGLNKLRISAVQEENLRKRQTEFGLLRDQPVATQVENPQIARRIAQLKDEQAHVARNTAMWQMYQQEITQAEAERGQALDAGMVSAATAMTRVTAFIETLRNEQAALGNAEEAWKKYGELVDAAKKHAAVANTTVEQLKAEQSELRKGSEEWQSYEGKIKAAQQEATSARQRVVELQNEQTQLAKSNTEWQGYERRIKAAQDAQTRVDARITQMRLEQRQVGQNTDEWQKYEREIAKAQKEKTGLQDTIDQLREEQSQVAKNSKAWQDYQKLIDEATKEQSKDRRLVVQAEQEATERFQNDIESLIGQTLDQTAMIQDAFTNVAYGITNAFSDAFGTLFAEGATLGRFMVVLGRQIGAALLGGLANYAGGKVAENIAQAFENHAKATAAMAEGFLNLNPAAFSAATMFEAAASQNVVSAAKWALLAGAASAGSAALGSTGGGGGGGPKTGAPGGASDIGGTEAEKAGKNGPQVIIYVDGFDPKNPMHQEKVWEGVSEAEERFGTTVTVLPRSAGGR